LSAASRRRRRRLQVGSIDDNKSGGGYAYRSSKAALNIVNKSLTIDLAQDNIICTLLHPG
jgi:NAD(P)-dependent dehydrogenase (short-subunit alcohol dehydrogenase family)